MEKSEFITDKEIYQKVILDQIPWTKKFLWLATSDLKDLYVSKKKKMVPFLEILSDLIAKGIMIRLIHAKEPGQAFRSDFDKYSNLIGGLERLLCPRAHFKAVIIDGKFAYTGSANLTGAGMGAKGVHRRNFETGIISSEPKLVFSIMEHFDNIWTGLQCEKCQRKQYCTAHHHFC